MATSPEVRHPATWLRRIAPAWPSWPQKGPTCRFLQPVSLISPQPPQLRIHPQCLPSWPQALATKCDYVTTVVHHHDVVPRASLASFEALRQEMLETQWEDNLTADVRSFSGKFLPFTASQYLSICILNHTSWCTQQNEAQWAQGHGTPSGPPTRDSLVSVLLATRAG